MKQIKVAFDGFWSDFNQDDNFFTKILKKHFEVIVCHNIEEADYLIYSVFIDRNVYLNFEGIRIFYTGENVVPDFNCCDYGIGFSYIDFEDRYFRFPLYANYYKDSHLFITERREERDETLLNRKFCACVISNANNINPTRRIIFEELSNYKNIDSGGRWKNNIGQSEGVKDKQAFLKEYKFSLAIENTSSRGYCTEKLVQAYAAGTIPIYWGDETVDEQFNTKAFIDGSKCGLDELVEKVKRVDESDELYLEMYHQPLILDKKGNIEEYRKKLERWLVEIFQQPKEEAFRRDRYGWGKVYAERLRVAESGKREKMRRIVHRLFGRKKDD